jgi:hypothetical protein
VAVRRQLHAARRTKLKQAARIGRRFIAQAPGGTIAGAFILYAIGDNLAVSIKPIVFFAAAIAVVVALWFFFKPQRAELPAPETARADSASAPLASASSASEAPMPGVSARSEVFELVIKSGRPVGGPKLLQVHEGEQVTLNIQSDSADELHLHGYDLHAHITPEQTASLQFNANRTGRFGLELHKAHTELGALEVYPR